MVFNFRILGLVRAKSKEEACDKLKDKFGSDFFSKHVELNGEVEDRKQAVDIE